MSGKTEETRTRWTKHVYEAEKSGLTSSQYAIKHGLSIKTFQWWKWQVNAWRREGVWPGEEASSGGEDKKSSLPEVRDAVACDPVPELPPEKTALGEGIIGYRKVCDLLGASKNSLQRALSVECKDGPVRMLRNGTRQEAWKWRDENHVRSWWASVNNKTPPDGEGDKEIDDEAVIRKLLGDEIWSDLETFRRRLDTPEVRLLQAARGEEKGITTAEVLLMVVGLGIANWPLD